MDNKLCCILNPKLMCFDCRAKLCTNCSYAGKLKARGDGKGNILHAAGIYVLCKPCLDEAKDFWEHEFIPVSHWEGDSKWT